MRLGVDASSLVETRSQKPTFLAEGKPVDPLAFCHDVLGVERLRLRLWVDPYDPQGRPYGGGTNDLATFLSLAKEGTKKGYGIFLDFHYSDFWTDPGKQTMPKSWEGLGLAELCERLSAYTAETLLSCKENGVEPAAVQIGNEITNGMLWPIGKLEGEGSPREGYDALCALLSAASKQVRLHCPKAQIVIHLERSHDQAVYREFFDQMDAHGVDFDVIGMSYYPYWHGDFAAFFANVDQLKARYHKPLWIVETAYAFSVLPAYVAGEPWVPLVNPERLAADGSRLEFPLDKQGQWTFVSELLRLSERHGIEEIDYWEPFWLPLQGGKWASEEGEEYIHERDKPTHNEWMNNCLFDYEGNANPALFAFRVK